ncbi:hypothetical protein P4637_03335 [Halalkalibacterium halodurans]|uniref:hypothetical protein n=1 Tax=Halalkalibacterium halodurans TaxID=86665 RepID=UPI002E1A5CF1|nr:hypothetical protein [Halalkalibacterium halodurans]MED4105532.1 hypothetical protein [Halalkalibacterium halodurans]MED4109262.1 hypothetical protein [Halalkalibacterium halodurans]MED4149724.1 hypothetical protein [Halalkalibacterium halodurans]
MHTKTSDLLDRFLEPLSNRPSYVKVLKHLLMQDTPSVKETAHELGYDVDTVYGQLWRASRFMGMDAGGLFSFQSAYIKFLEKELMKEEQHERGA